MEENETKLCSNCKRDIAAANYIMHTAHCQRNIQLCDSCNEPVPRKDIDQHNEEFHSTVACEKCGQSMERCKLEEHNKVSCVKRPIPCSYCEMDCTFDGVKEHESYCGSRTEICIFCRQYVMIKDEKEHQATNCKMLQKNLLSDTAKHDEMNNKPEAKRGKKNRRNNAAMQSLDKNSCNKLSVKDNSPLSSENSSSNSDSNVAIGESRVCMPSEEIDEILAFQMVKDEFEGIGTVNESSETPSSNEIDEILAYQMLRGDGIDDIGRTDQFDDPEGALSYLMNTFPSSYLHASLFPDQIPLFEEGSLYSHNFANVLEENVIRKEEPIVPSQKNFGETVVLPCEFCSELYPEDQLIQHQSGCRPDIVHGPLDKTEEKPLSSLLPIAEKDYSIYESVNEKNKFNHLSCGIVCEFCSEKFPEEEIVRHQLNCKDEISQKALPANPLFPSTAKEHVTNGQKLSPSSSPLQRRSARHQSDPIFDNGIKSGNLSKLSYKAGKNNQTALSYADCISHQEDKKKTNILKDVPEPIYYGKLGRNERWHPGKVDYKNYPTYSGVHKEPINNVLKRASRGLTEIERAEKNKAETFRTHNNAIRRYETQKSSIASSAENSFRSHQTSSSYGARPKNAALESLSKNSAFDSQLSNEVNEYPRRYHQETKNKNSSKSHNYSDCLKDKDPNFRRKR